MIDEIDRRLRDWAGSVVADTDAILGLPSEGAQGRGISFQLMEIVNATPSRRDQPRPYELSLRYLVTTWAQTPDEAHHLLGELLFAALDKRDCQVDLNPLPVDAWRAFGLAPQPSFMLEVPLVRERPQVVKRVLEPPEVRLSAITSLDGVVLGPRDVPIPRARVEIPNSNGATYTDAHGRFRFGAVPVEPRVEQLRIVAKGHEQLVAVPPGDAQPLIVRFHPKEP